MKLIHYTDVEPVPSDKVGITGAEGLSFRFLIGPGDGAPHFSMMLLILSPNGHTPDHSHEREEEIYVKSGSGEIKTEGNRTQVRKGDVFYLAPNEQHQFLNTGPEDLELLCVTLNQTE